jgi:hypothetical protein
LPPPLDAYECHQPHPTREASSRISTTQTTQHAISLAGSRLSLVLTQACSSCRVTVRSRSAALRRDARDTSSRAERSSLGKAGGEIVLRFLGFEAVVTALTLLAVHPRPCPRCLESSESPSLSSALEPPSLTGTAGSSSDRSATETACCELFCFACPCLSLLRRLMNLCNHCEITPCPSSSHAHARRRRHTSCRFAPSRACPLFPIPPSVSRTGMDRAYYLLTCGQTLATKAAKLRH